MLLSLKLCGIFALCSNGSSPIAIILLAFCTESFLILEQKKEGGMNNFSCTFQVFRYELAPLLSVYRFDLFELNLDCNHEITRSSKMVHLSNLQG